MTIENEYRLDLREKPIGCALGEKQRVEKCPQCGKGAVLFKRTTARNGSRSEVWHHEIRIYLDEKHNPKRDPNVPSCNLVLSASAAAKRDEQAARVAR